jgi:hypothetical protein
MGMDILVEATMNQISETTMIGKTITAPDITIRSAATAALLTQAALAAGMAEASAAAMAAALAVVMAAVEATAVAADIVSRETAPLDRSSHA